MIRAELTGSSTASACGLTARSRSPVLALCRQLVEADHDAEMPFEAYRGDVLCLKVHSIGEAAGLEVNSRGSRFARACDVRAAPPVRSTTKSDSRGLGGLPWPLNGSPPKAERGARRMRARNFDRILTSATPSRAFCNLNNLTCRKR